MGPQVMHANAITKQQSMEAAVERDRQLLKAGLSPLPFGIAMPRFSGVVATVRQMMQVVGIPSWSGVVARHLVASLAPAQTR
jgi:hypothetical protein